MRSNPGPIPRSLGALLLPVGALLLAAACGGDGPTEPGGNGTAQVATVVVTPAADTLTALGSTVQLSARALDANGDEIPGAEITWSTSDQGILTVDEQGVAEAVANGEAEVTAAASGVTASAALAVIQQVSGVTVTPTTATLTTEGATQQFDASATDENGNAVQGARFVWASENDAVVTVDSAGLATARGNGQAAITVTARDVPANAVVTVNQAIDRLAFRTEPTDAVAGEAINPAVQVAILDADGNVVSDAENAVTLTLGTNPGGGTLSGATTVNAVSGVATFSNVFLDAAAAGYTLAATLGGSTTMASQPFDVAPGPAARLTFVGQPTDATAGAALSPAVQVEIRDDYGNPVSGSTADVSVSLAANPGGGTLSGSVTAAASGGVAGFDDLWIDRAAAGYRLQATSASLDPDVSASFAVTPGPAARLGFVTRPDDVEGQEPLSPVVQVGFRDDFGNAVTGVSAEVSVSLGTNPTGDALEGPTTTASVDGVASFPGLSLALPGRGYTLVASSPGLTGAESELFNVLLTFAQVSGSENHTCGVTVAGHAYCWGQNDQGQLGTGTKDDAIVPHPAPEPVTGDLTFAEVRAGGQHACGLTTAGEALCWGNNSAGQLGVGFASGSGVADPQPVTGGLVFSRLDAGLYHTCGVTAGDEAYCWGSNTYGEIGDGTTTNRPAPTAVSGGLPLATVSAGTFYTCGVTTADEAYCWGQNPSGQLGDGTMTDRSTPTAVAGGLSFTGVTAAERHTCGVTTSDAAYCWGDNASGRLGDGTETARLTPTAVAGGLSFAALATGSFHSCGVTTSGEARCWGENVGGQLGDGTNTKRLTPTAVAGGLSYGGITAGRRHTCGRSPAGTVRCWGENGYGQLGDGTTDPSSTPSRVVQ